MGPCDLFSGNTGLSGLGISVIGRRRVRSGEKVSCLLATAGPQVLPSEAPWVPLSHRLDTNLSQTDQGTSGGHGLQLQGKVWESLPAALEPLDSRLDLSLFP